MQTANKGFAEALNKVAHWELHWYTWGSDELILVVGMENNKYEMMQSIQLKNKMTGNVHNKK